MLSATILPKRPSAGNCALPAETPRQQPDQSSRRHQQPERPDGLDVRRIDRPGPEPTDRENQQVDRYQKGSHAQQLQQQVAGDRPNHSDPIVSGAGRERSSRRVQRAIQRRIRCQGEDKEGRDDKHEKADQLVESTIGRRSKCACQYSHVGVGAPRRFTSFLSAHSTCPTQRRQTPPLHAQRSETRKPAACPKYARARTDYPKNAPPGDGKCVPWPLAK